MRLLVSHQLTKEECMRVGGLTHYLIIFIIHDLTDILLHMSDDSNIQKCIKHLAI